MPEVVDDPAPVRWQFERGRWAARRDASFAPPPATCYIRKGCIGEIGMAAGNGSLSCVGMGMMLGAHIGPRARATIEQADVVFGAVSDPIVELWLQQMHPDVRRLQPCYAEGKSRNDTYRELVAAMLAEARAGRRMCGAFYGHPCLFAPLPDQATPPPPPHGFHNE